MIKTIFFDLDGTLLNSKKQIDNETKSVLLKCKEKGIKLFVATARPPMLHKMLNWTDNELNIFDGGLYCNGACQQISNSIEYKFIPSEIVSYCVNEVKKYKSLNIALQMENGLHAFNNPLEDFAYELWGVNKSDTLEITKTCETKTVKLLIYYENIVDSKTQIPDDLVDNLHQVCSEKSRVYLTDNGKVIQITNKTASKFSGIESVRHELKLDKSEIAVFGDDMNDIEMLQGYTHSVAMGNADLNVKQTAKYVTKSNDENGVAYAIKHILKLY